MDLIIVESGTKAKKIASFLGRGWMVEACNGHVQDLPSSGAGKDSRRAMWAASRDSLPSPPWEWTERAESVLSKILRKAREKGVTRVHIATDPDREGEFIAWRLVEIMSEFESVDRIEFNEITESAVRAALASPREVDMSLVDAAKVRRYMDRLVGFRASKFARAWKLRSMGRVQTPTLGFVVARELEREAFVPQPYFSVRCEASGLGFKFRFHEKEDPDAWFDRDANPPKHHPDRTDDRELAETAHASLIAHGGLELTRVEQGKRSQRPDPPFSTPSLLRVAGAHHRLGWSANRIMSIASELYQAGQITYIRTDSTRTNPSAREAMRKHVIKRWGESHIGEGVVGSDAKEGAKNVQDAHEAIRPTEPAIEKPEGLSDQQMILYRLIWSRFAASQMSPSRYESLSMDAAVPDFDRRLTGSVSWRVHDGWEAAYGDLRRTPRIAPPSPEPSVGATLELDGDPTLIEDETKPPPRYRQHTLVERMQQEGIGRPSTYAATISRLIDRSYAVEEERALAPTEEGRKLWIEIAPMYSDGDSDSGIFRSGFTATMEENLDRIEGGEIEAPEVWHGFVDEFQNLHGKAIEKRRERPTQRQADYLNSLLSSADDDLRNEVLGDSEVSELTGEQARAAIELLAEQSAPPAASDKQISYIESLSKRAGLSESEACALLEVEGWGDLTGGRDGTASALIEALKSLDTGGSQEEATEKQREYVRSLMEKAESTETAICALVGVESIDAMTKSQASEVIEELRDRLGIKGRGRRRNSRSRSN